MMFFNLLLNLIFFFSLLSRISRWVSLIQQKEYRLDRLLAFFKTNAGKSELKHIIDLPRSQSSFKRPKLTLRSFLLIVLSTILIFIIPIQTIFDLAALYILVPIFVVAANLPGSLVSIVITHYYQLRSRRLISIYQPTIIGITGSYGKTTTKQLLTHLLQTKHSIWVSPKSINTPFSLPYNFCKTYKGQSLVIIEFAAYKQGEIKHLTTIFPPHMAIITGLTHQHLALFGTFSNLISAKSELPLSLPHGSSVFINNSDINIDHITRKLKHLKIISPVGRYLKNVRISHTGRLSFSYNQTSVRTQIIGLHYRSNLELAIACALSLSVTPAQIVTALTRFTPTDHFIRLHRHSSGTTLVIDDKTSNPHGFYHAINLIKSLPASHKVIITSGIIDLGTKSLTTHRQLALQIRQVFSACIYSGNTETQVFKSILGPKFYLIKNFSEFTSVISSHLSPKSIILIEGRIPVIFHQYLTDPPHDSRL